MEVAQERLHFVAGKDYGKSGGPPGTDDLIKAGELDAQDVPVEEEEGAQGLVLR